MALNARVDDVLLCSFLRHLIRFAVNGDHNGVLSQKWKLLCYVYKFATTIADLTHHRVYDVIEGKSRNLVESKLMRYKGRDKVKVVCMDLSSSYRSIVRRCFPKAKIVADRFHVIRLVLYHIMEFWLAFACANRLALRVFCLRQNLIRASLELQTSPRRGKMEQKADIPIAKTWR